MDNLQAVADFIYHWFFLGVIGYILRGWVADKVKKFWINRSERTIAIWQHYSNRAQGKGHDHVDVLDCHDQRCKVFTSYAS